MTSGKCGTSGGIRCDGVRALDCLRTVDGAVRRGSRDCGGVAMNESVSDLRKLARVTKEQELNSPGLTARAVAALTGATIHQLRYWDEIHLVVPSIQSTGGRTGVARIYSRGDLLRVKDICSHLENGCSLQELRKQERLFGVFV